MCLKRRSFFFRAGNKLERFMLWLNYASHRTWENVKRSGGNDKQCSSNSTQSCLSETFGEEYHLLGVLPASACVLLVSPSSSVFLYELRVLTLILKDQWWVSCDNLQRWPAGGKGQELNTGYTQRERSLTGLRAAPGPGGSQWLAENANGGRALWTALRSILQIEQEFEPLTLTSVTNLHRWPVANSGPFISPLTPFFKWISSHCPHSEPFLSPTSSLH